MVINILNFITLIVLLLASGLFTIQESGMIILNSTVYKIECKEKSELTSSNYEGHFLWNKNRLEINLSYDIYQSNTKILLIINISYICWKIPKLINNQYFICFWFKFIEIALFLHQTWLSSMIFIFFSNFSQI